MGKNQEIRIFSKKKQQFQAKHLSIINENVCGLGPALILHIQESPLPIAVPLLHFGLSNALVAVAFHVEQHPNPLHSVFFVFVVGDVAATSAGGFLAESGDRRAEDVLAPTVVTDKREGFIEYSLR